MKRSILILLLFALLLSAVVSCGSTVENTPAGTTDTQSATEPEETEAPGIPEPDLPQKDYGGADFTILAHMGESASYKELFIAADTMDGEIVNDTVFNRNILIEDKFNINWNVIPDDKAWTTARNLIFAGDSSFDVIDTQANQMSSLATDGYLFNFLDLDYVNLDAPYWSEGVAKDLTVGDTLYLMPNDLSMRFMDSTRFCYFNKRLAADYELGDLYDVVYADKWTLDNFLETVRMVSADTNGDGVYDEADTYGMLTESSQMVGNFITASGIHLTETDKEGNITVTCITEKTEALLAKMKDALYNVQWAKDFEDLPQKVTGFAHVYNYGRSLFAAGQFLFVQNGLNIISQFREMEDDFGVLPMPKYDEAQEGYYHRADPYSLLFALPKTLADPERAGIVMEYGGWLSNKMVFPAYYETTILQKRVRDERDIDMLTLIRQSSRYEITEIFNIGIRSILTSAYKNGNLMSSYEKEKTSIEKKLETLSESLLQGK